MTSDDPSGVRDAYREATEHLVALVEGIEPAALDGPGTEEWSLRVLVAHAAGAVLSLERVLATPVDPGAPRLESAAGYFRAVFELPGVHEGIGERATARAALLGDEPARVLARDAARVAPLVASTDLTRQVQPFTHRMDFGDYLVTRVCELVLHGADVELALGRTPTAPPPAARLVRDVMVELAADADPLLVACALAGRRTPGGCDVLR